MLAKPIALFGTLIIGIVCATLTDSNKVSLKLEETLEIKGIANVMVSFFGGNAEVIKLIENGKFKTRSEKIFEMKSLLQQQADISQKNVRKLLTDNQIHFKSFWITNQIYIKGATRNIINLLLTFSDFVSKIDEEEVIPVPKHFKVTPAPMPHNQQNAPGWGHEKIQVPEAWNISKTRGRGIVFSNMDGGVASLHSALESSYRDDHGWLAPEYETPTDRPFADSYTGTYSMGVMMSIAPEAQWIACRSCGFWFCYQNWVLACGEFNLCPTLVDGSNADCSLSPNVITHNFGSDQDQTWFQPVVDSFIAADIIPVYPAGSRIRFECGFIENPGGFWTNGRWPNKAGYGQGHVNLIAKYLSAPGEEILTTAPRPNNSFVEVSSCHIAASHVAGVVALLKSMNPTLTFEEIRQALLDGVQTDLRSRDKNCGGIPDTTFPNNHYGYGRLNALRSVEIIQAGLKK